MDDQHFVTAYVELDGLDSISMDIFLSLAEQFHARAHYVPSRAEVRRSGSQKSTRLSLSRLKVDYSSAGLIIGRGVDACRISSFTATKDATDNNWTPDCAALINQLGNSTNLALLYKLSKGSSFSILNDVEWVIAWLAAKGVMCDSGFGSGMREISSPLAYFYGIVFRDGDKPPIGGLFEPGRINNWVEFNYKKHQSRSATIRDIFEVNVLTQDHLRARVSGQQLYEWIGSNPSRGEVSYAGDYYLWRIHPERLEDIRRQLDRSGLVAAGRSAKHIV